ncbi:unnamed protein product, partial [Gongylonema pulchrum]|uniref:F-box domain-containing protein n=1 Tax=Gongylonema pulchrum TaxID=637853 RepID=A0A183DWP5_9BILA
MGFYAPPTPNHGFFETGSSVYGGIITDHDASPTCSSKNFYIPQHNLAFHWQRPDMVPHTVNFPRLLTRFLEKGRSDIWCRPVGHWPYEVCRSQLRNRNLLAVSVEDSNMPVRLWAVDELSPRKQLVEFRLRLKSRKGFEKWVIASEDSDEEADDIYGSARMASETVSQQVSGSCHDETDVTMVKNSNGRRHRHVLNLKTPLLELRSWKRRDRRCQILARGEKELYLCDTDEGVAWTLFTDPVLSLSVVPHMNDEIVFLDAASQIWYGKVGENFNRVKCGHAIESVASSDHPRLVYAAGKDNVSLIDLRDGTSNGETLYTVPDFDDTSRNSYQYQFVLVDERMRGLVLLEMTHSIYQGGHHVVCAPPIQDTARNGAIYPFYILQHAVNPEVQTFSLYRHSNSSHWSSLAAIRRLKEPRDMATFYREHPKYEVKISREAERQLFGKGPTRAICCLNTDGIRSKYRSYLFRMMNDGSLWYEA